MWQRFFKWIPLLGLILLLSQCGSGLDLDVLPDSSGSSPWGGGQAQPSLDDPGADHQGPVPIDEGDPDINSFKVTPPGDGDEDPTINPILTGEFSDQIGQ